MFCWRKEYFVNFVIFALCSLPLAEAKTIRLDQTDLDGRHFAYLYQWFNPDSKPRAIVIAVHGLTMHGSVFDSLASHLSEEGMLVLAPDLPGYGRRHLSGKKNKASDKGSLVSYSQSLDEIGDIIKAAKNSYKNLPIFCIGESMGANLVLYASQNQSTAVSGLILASPALKPRLHINMSSRSVKDDVTMLVGLIDSNASLDLAPYIKEYASEDANVAKGVLNDPLVRTRLSCQDIWKSYATMQAVYKKANLLGESTATLIMQGSKDKVLQSKSIIKLVSNLNTNDLTVRWFQGRGHIILETSDPKADAVETIDEWLKIHINKPLSQTKLTIEEQSSVQPRLSDNVGNSFVLPATIK